VAVSVAVPNAQILSPYSDQGVTTLPPTVSSLTPDQDALAVARTLQGDVNAFNELVLRYQKLAFSVAYRILQSREMADDIVQDSFLKAFCVLKSFRGGSFKAWLLRIVINRCYDQQRRLRYWEHTVLSDDDTDEGETGHSCQPIALQESPQEFVERKELSALLERGIRNLSLEQRMVIVLYDIHGCSYLEIQAITGVEMGTIKSRLSRARARLRDILLAG
jgi:RNA polymerase sigma-70 factor (ECF subfamily)